MKTCADLLGPELAAVSARLVPAPFRLLSVRGPDARDFLHRLCSQDVLGMEAGEARPAAFLTPKGKLESLVWLGAGAGSVFVEVQEHEAARVAALLERYHFGERLAVEVPEGFECSMAWGPKAWEVARVARRACIEGAEGICLAGECRGLRWARWHGPTGSLPEIPLPSVARGEWELRRIAAGIPWMGVDADATTLGPEAGIEDHLDAGKGCYTGQEIVARIQTYGHVNRELRRLRIAGGGEIARGTAIEDHSGAPVGRVVSAAALPGAGQRLGLGYLPREVAAQAETSGLHLAGEAGATVALAD